MADMFDPASPCEPMTQEQTKGINWWPEEDLGRGPNNFRDLKEIASEILDRMAGQWSDFLGYDLGSMYGHGKPCPKCGGQDRLHAHRDSALTGSLRCRKCHVKGESNGIGSYAWIKSIAWHEAVLEIAEKIGVRTKNDASTPKPKPLSIIETVAKNKRMPLHSFLKFGVKEDVRAGKPVARVDVYNEFGEVFSYFDMTSDKNCKGLCKTGKGNAGLFFPGRTPVRGETWLITEGVKDAAALVSLGFLACGMPTNRLFDKYAQLFAGVDVVMVPDLDSAGMDGMQASLKRLYNIAKSTAYARLPGEIKDKDGDGVREILAKENGERLVREAIDKAKEWEPPRRESSRLSQRQRQREDTINQLQETTDQWEVVCVIGEPNMFRLSGEFFDKAGEYLEMPIETLASFSKFQNCIGEKCRQWLDPDTAEAWPFIVQQLLARAVDVDGGVERAQTRLVANTLFNLITTLKIPTTSHRLASDVMNDAQYFGVSKDGSTYWIEFSRLCEELDRIIKDFKPISLTRCFEICHIEYGYIRISDNGGPSTGRRWRQIDPAGLIRIGDYGQFDTPESVQHQAKRDRSPTTKPISVYDPDGTMDREPDELQGDMQYENDTYGETM